MPRKRDAWNTLTVRPLTGVLDTRSFAEDVAPGTLLFAQDVQVLGGTKLCRRTGHDRAFKQYINSFNPVLTYTNWDFHDQSSLTNLGVTPESITLAFEAVDNSGNHWLYVGTQSQIAFLNMATGLWTLLIDGQGGETQSGIPNVRFKASILQNTILFTNNVDVPFFAPVGVATVTTFTAYASSLALTQSLVTVSWNGFQFLMNNVEQGSLVSSRVRWSDLNNAASVTGWISTLPSIANFQDLPYGDAILAAVPIANNLYIFTAQSIWLVSTTTAVDGTGTALVFNFQQIYTNPNSRSGCLYYPNAIISTGNAIYYAAADGIYYFDPYLPQPERTEWIYKATSFVFGDTSSTIVPTCCQSPVMEIYPDEKEIYFSWPEVSLNVTGLCVNTRTLCINYLYKSVATLSHGYSVFANFQPSSNPPLPCNLAPLFIGASCQDNCLKELSDIIYSRAFCTNAATGQGSVIEGVYVPFTGDYEYQGYYSIFRLLLPTQAYNLEKSIRRILLEVSAGTQSNPCVIRLRVGTSFNALDPNTTGTNCVVPWYQMPDMPLECLDTETVAQYLAQNIQRQTAVEWAMMLGGRFIYLEFSIANQDGSPAIGGAACFERLEAQVRLCPPGFH